jgi:hypothetical protein
MFPVLLHETDLPLPRDNDEIRLVAMSAACHAKEIAAAYELAHPRQGMMYPAYLQLANALKLIQLKCRDLKIALRAYRKWLRAKEN